MELFKCDAHQHHLNERLDLASKSRIITIIFNASGATIVTASL